MRFYRKVSTIHLAHKIVKSLKYSKYLQSDLYLEVKVNLFYLPDVDDSKNRENKAQNDEYYFCSVLVEDSFIDQTCHVLVHRERYCVLDCFYMLKVK